MIDLAHQREAEQARDHMLDLQAAADQAAVAYQHAVRRLRTDGASLREIADALGMSYQRVHQIVDVGSGKGAIRESPDDLTCSFCGAPSRQIRKLIAGPNVYICNRCIDLANEVRARGIGQADAWTPMEPEADPEARCSFCGKARRETASMVVVAEATASPGKRGWRRSSRRSRGVRECAECLDLCNQIVTESDH